MIPTRRAAWWLAASTSWVLALALGCGMDATARLVAELRGGDLESRKRATASLLTAPNQAVGVIDALAEGLRNDDSDLRRLSALALDRLGPAARPALAVLEKSLGDPEASVRVAAALAILRCDPKRVAPRAILLAEIRRPNPHVMLAVGELGPAAHWAVHAFRPLLDHHAAPIRQLARQSLTSIGTKELGQQRSDAPPGLP